MVHYQKVLDFWFGKPNNPEYGQQRKVWFIKNTAFDEEVRSHFLEIYNQAAQGKLDAWREYPLGCLALIIILDQFPRNMFRNTPQAFATDAQALQIAQKAVDRNFDQPLLPVQRWFVYLPFEHSENLHHQKLCLELFSQLEHDPQSASTIEYAYKHKVVIERFGRFPHRNKILNRESTKEEKDFLSQPGSSF